MCVCVCSSSTVHKLMPAVFLVVAALFQDRRTETEENFDRTLLTKNGAVLKFRPDSVNAPARLPPCVTHGGTEGKEMRSDEQGQETHRHRHRHTDTQTHRHTGTQAHRHTDTHTGTHTQIHIRVPCPPCQIPLSVLGACCCPPSTPCRRKPPPIRPCVRVGCGNVSRYATAHGNHRICSLECYKLLSQQQQQKS